MSRFQSVTDTLQVMCLSELPRRAHRCLISAQQQRCSLRGDTMTQSSQETTNTHRGQEAAAPRSHCTAEEGVKSITGKAGTMGGGLPTAETRSHCTVRSFCGSVSNSLGCRCLKHAHRATHSSNVHEKLLWAPLV